MNKIQLTLFALVLLMGISCKHRKKIQESPKNTSVEVQENATQKTSYRLIVSFISRGAGIDTKLYSTVTDFLEKHPKKPVYEKKHWGREGEVDLLLQLNEFKSSSEKDQFIKELKSLTGNAERIHFKENSVSR